MNMGRIDEGYEHALGIMRENATPLGFAASSERFVNYYSIWARDHSICTIAALLSNDPDLVFTAIRGLTTLLRRQSDSGQLPSYIEIESRKKVYGGLGSITSVDSNMWVLIAAAEVYKRTHHKRFISRVNLERYLKIYRLIRGFDSNSCGLIETHVSGDWADVFERTYHVLYDECLYYLALRAVRYLFSSALESDVDIPEERRKRFARVIRYTQRRSRLAKRRINSVFWFTAENIPRIRDDYMIRDHIVPENYRFYQSHLRPFEHFWQHRFDSFGNVLAILGRVADKKKVRTIFDYVAEKGIEDPFPLSALDPVVDPGDKEWHPIYEEKELPHTYHNGGIWAMIGGFWIHALRKNGQKRRAKRNLMALARQLAAQNWQFHEYMHGKTGAEMGRSRQCWSAAGYIIACSDARLFGW